jgi:hypothetical protein
MRSFYKIAHSHSLGSPSRHNRTQSGRASKEKWGIHLFLGNECIALKDKEGRIYFEK